MAGILLFLKVLPTAGPTFGPCPPPWSTCRGEERGVGSQLHLPPPPAPTQYCLQLGYGGQEESQLEQGAGGGARVCDSPFLLKRVE